jgi:hypothetical protein
MISQTKSPQSKTHLVSVIQKLKPSTKFEVVEVFNSSDKQTINKMFDKYHKQNGHFSVMFIDGGK